jgi:hypothetical protein
VLKSTISKITTHLGMVFHLGLSSDSCRILLSTYIYQSLPIIVKSIKESVSLNFLLTTVYFSTCSWSFELYGYWLRTLLLCEDLFDSLNLFELILEVIAFLLIANQTLFPKFLFLSLWHSHKVLLLKRSFLLKLHLDLLSQLISHTYLSCLLIIL